MDTLSFSGRYSDGKTAATTTVAVSLGDALMLTGAGEPVAWSYDNLQSAAPLEADEAEVLLRNDAFPGATLFVNQSGFAAELLRRAPHLTPAAHRWRFAIPGLSIAAVILLGVGAVYAFGLNPAQDAARLVPHGLRISIGKQAMASMVAGSAVCAAPEGVKALSQLVSELSAASNSGNDYKVEVVNSPVVNAFALPGEQIVIFNGLIEEAKSADEVAGVLAHEMGHGIELHPEAGLIRGLGLSALIELLATGQSSTLANTGNLLLQLHYSREAEHQADVHALEILKAADISPKPFSGFFNRLLKRGDVADLGILNTHPPTPERAKMAADAATYPGHPALSGTDWQALKKICG